jgi:hypothetical protein
MKQDVDEECQNDEPVMVADIHRQMRELHLARRSSASSNSTNRSESRQKRHGLSRGRNNKVSPDSSNGSVSDRKEKRLKSAPPNRHRAMDDGDDGVQDPLEPWSTKDIMNINKLLDDSNNDEEEEEEG